MRDWKKQVLIDLDHVFQDGIGVFKTHWDWSVKRVDRVFRRVDFLRRYQAQISQLMKLGAAQQAASGGDGSRLVESMINQFAPRLAADLGIDPEKSKTDDRALRKILDFLKSGKGEQVIYKTDEVTTSMPRSVAISAVDLIVNGRTGCIQKAERVTHRMFMTRSNFEQTAKDHQWSPDVVNEVLEKTKKATTSSRTATHTGISFSSNEFDKYSREGVLGFGNEDLIEVWESYFWHKGEDGRPERVWATIAPGAHDVTKSSGPIPLLTPVRPSPYAHGETPFNVINFEVTEDRFYASRGVPAKIDDLDWEITQRHRSERNRRDMLAPVFRRRRN